MESFSLNDQKKENGIYLNHYLDLFWGKGVVLSYVCMCLWMVWVGFVFDLESINLEKRFSGNPIVMDHTTDC